MERTTLKINGINRAGLEGAPQAGDCHEVINIRRKDGSWIGVKGKTSVKALSLIYAKLYVHQSDTLRVLLGYRSADGKIYRVNENGSDTLVYTIGAELSLRFNALGNVLIVTNETNARTHWLLYDVQENAYKYLGDKLPSPVDIILNSSDVTGNLITGRVVNPKNTDLAEAAKQLQEQYEAVLAKGYREWKEQGLFHGFIVVRTALELYDGTFIGHSKPILFYNTDSPNHGDISIITETAGDAARRITTAFGGRHLEYTIPSASQGAIDAARSQFKDIVKSMVIFASRPFDRYPTTGYKYDGSNPTLVADENLTADRLIKEQVLYKIESINIEDLDSTTTPKRFELDWNLVHTDRDLPMEELSAHQLVSGFSMVYNSRLWLSNVTTIFQPPTPPNASMLTVDTTAKTIAFEVLLKTSQGTIAVRSATLTTSKSIIGLPLLLYYPDSRAYEFRILSKPSGGNDFIVIGSFKLDPHPTYNFAFNYLKDFPNAGMYDYSNIFDLDSILGKPIADAPVGLMHDINRVQVSQVQNPFLFPAKNSYQVGTGEIVGLGVNTTPLSDLQYGLHPVMVFSRSGIWAMELSVGDVLVTRTFPISEDVCNNSKSITGSGDMVFFTTSKGLYAIAGRDVRLASSSLNGAHISPLSSGQANATYLKGVQNVFPDPTLAISQASFNDYLAGATLGVDYDHDELIVSNPTYGYSYVFNTTDRVWYKRSESFKLFSTAWPDTYAIRSDNALVRVNMETGDSLPVYIETRDIDLGAFVKVDRLSFNLSIVSKDSIKQLALIAFGSGLRESNHAVLNAKSVPTANVHDRVVLTRLLRSARFVRLVFSGDVASLTLNDIAFDRERRWGKL